MGGAAGRGGLLPPEQAGGPEQAHAPTNRRQAHREGVCRAHGGDVLQRSFRGNVRSVRCFKVVCCGWQVLAAVDTLMDNMPFHDDVAVILDQVSGGDDRSAGRNLP